LLLLTFDHEVLGLLHTHFVSFKTIVSYFLVLVLIIRLHITNDWT
jgi:hypothetical protein